MSSAVELKPYLGGEVQRLSRLGDRWSYEVNCQPMRVAQAGALVAALLQGLSQKVTCRVYQDGFPYSDYSNGTVAAAKASGANTIQHTGGGTPIAGQMFSIVKSGTRYLHMISAVSGTTLTILPSLKISLAGGEVLEFAEPKIEGFIDGQEQSWQVGMVANLGLSFRINEAQ